MPKLDKITVTKTGGKNDEPVEVDIDSLVRERIRNAFADGIEIEQQVKKQFEQIRDGVRGKGKRFRL